MVNSNGLSKGLSKTNEENMKQTLEMLHSKKKQLLKILDLESTDEFFNKKATLNSIVKSLNYLKESRNNFINEDEYNGFKSLEKDFIDKIATYERDVNVNKDNLLSEEDYLSKKNELESLKATYLDLSRSSRVPKENILPKLEEIQQEMREKLPQFCSFVIDIYKKNFENIKLIIKDLVEKLKVPLFDIDANGEDYNNLNTMQKILMQYALFKQIYVKDFVFIIPQSKEEEDFINKLTLLEEKFNDFYILNKK